MNNFIRVKGNPKTIGLINICHFAELILKEAFDSLGIFCKVTLCQLYNLLLA